METSFSEVHLLAQLCLDLYRPEESQCLCEDDVGKEERHIGVTNPFKDLLKFRCKYFKKWHPTALWGVEYHLED